MKKFFMIMVILCMAVVFAIPMFAMEPTGPPGEMLVAALDDTADHSVPLVTTEIYISQYFVSGSNPGMLAGLMRGSLDNLLNIAEDYCLSARATEAALFVG